MGPYKVKKDILILKEYFDEKNMDLKMIKQPSLTHHGVCYNMLRTSWLIYMNSKYKDKKNVNYFIKIK